MYEVGDPDNEQEWERSKLGATGPKYRDLFKSATMLLTNMLNNCRSVNKAEHWAGIDLSNNNQTLKAIFEILVAASNCTVETIEGIDHFTFHPKFIGMLVVQPSFGCYNTTVEWPIDTTGRKKVINSRSTSASLPPTSESTGSRRVSSEKKRNKKNQGG